MKKPDIKILIIQGIFTIIGAVTSLIMLKRTLVSDPDILTLLSSIIFVIVYLFIIFYSIVNYRKDDLQYKVAVYFYAALLGIEILYSGKLMGNMGLGEISTLIVNVCNLICFALVIKFAETLENRKSALISISVSVLIKYLVEFWLIWMMFDQIELIHVLTALSVPVLGTTVLLAYTHKYGND
ncbi:MAG: hypothetical protein IJI92_10755 [Erysipelotrichaceae bacterium]|jgi:hypothetical protein|nr:hypothetical protein [Erysipelotrichaceae bacterium]MBQ6494331.1 hypothetical protein [Erysipelotrichaceae bacterium]